MKSDEHVALENEWATSERWHGIKRGYTAADDQFRVNFLGHFLQLPAHVDGVANGGVDTSAVQTFTCRLSAILRTRIMVSSVMVVER